MRFVFDLHTHSSASDGAYSPSGLVDHAASAGITHLALTDHDTTDGIKEAQTAANERGDIRIIPAVEISVTWQEKSVHIVGLNIDTQNPLLQEGLSSLQTVRLRRAEEIGKRLCKHGIASAFKGAQELAGKGMITRTHFARYLCHLGLAPGLKEVFDRFLVPGKPGYVPTRWAAMHEAVNWIRQAGGVAVLAHPQRYKLTGSWMRRLLSEFREVGGSALEVISGTGGPNDIQAAALNAQKFELLASVGSDFHSFEHRWVKLGQLPSLPENLKPVWDLWHD